MNPFGAPEPGKPKMYWADEEGKTKTLDARRAVVPLDAERGTNAENRVEQEPERETPTKTRLQRLSTKSEPTLRSEKDFVNLSE